MGSGHWRTTYELPHPKMFSTHMDSTRLECLDCWTSYTTFTRLCKVTTLRQVLTPLLAMYNPVVLLRVLLATNLLNQRIYGTLSSVEHQSTTTVQYHVALPRAELVFHTCRRSFRESTTSRCPDPPAPPRAVGLNIFGSVDSRRPSPDTAVAISRMLSHDPGWAVILIKCYVLLSHDPQLKPGFIFLCPYHVCVFLQL